MALECCRYIGSYVDASSNSYMYFYANGNYVAHSVSDGSNRLSRYRCNLPCLPEGDYGVRERERERVREREREGERERERLAEHTLAWV